MTAARNKNTRMLSFVVANITPTIYTPFKREVGVNGCHSKSQAFTQEDKV